MIDYNDRFFWDQDEFTFSECNPPTEDEVNHANVVLTKIVSLFQI